MKEQDHIAQETWEWGNADQGWLPDSKNFTEMEKTINNNPTDKTVCLCSKLNMRFKKQAKFTMTGVYYFNKDQ